MAKGIFAYIFIINLAIAFVFPVFASGSTLKLNITTDKQVYDILEKVSVNGNLTLDGQPVSDALVAIEIDDPKNETFVVRTLTIGSVNPDTCLVEIEELVPCDRYGNPQNSFQRGGYCGFKIKIKNNAATSYNVTTILNLFYGNRVPYAVFIFFKGRIDSGQNITYTNWPIPVPTDAVVGDAFAFASAYDKLPRDGGFAYCPEKSATFKIVNSGYGLSKLAGAGIPTQSPAGTFNLTVGLTLTNVRLGNYTIYARTYYQMRIAFSKIMFQVTLRGDLYVDGKIDMKDVAIVAKAFGTSPGDLLWNPLADLNPDGKIDMKDVAIVARAFGTKAVIDS